MKSLIMAISIGNTNITFGIYTDKNELIAHDKIPNLRASRFFKDWKARKDSGQIASDKIVSAVSHVLTVATNPTVDRLVSHWVKDVFHLKPLRFRNDFTVPMPVLVKEPEKVGGDRLLNAFAAYKRTNALTLVVDFGTAITFNVVSGKGEFLGDAIAPGFNSLAKALHEDCALLPLVTPRITHTAIGKNTEDAIGSGIYFGALGLAANIIDKIISQLGKKPVVIATGGDTVLLKGQLPVIDEIIPDLTLIGLVQSYRDGKK